MEHAGTELGASNLAIGCLLSWQIENRA